MNTQTPVERIRWLEATNGAGEEIPPFALVRVTAVSSDGVLTLGKPNADADPCLFVNGPTSIPTSGFGACAKPSRALHCKYNSGDGTPANGESWGSRNGDWALRKTKTDGTTANSGFKILGGVTSGRVMAHVCQ